MNRTNALLREERREKREERREKDNLETAKEGGVYN
jgi:hypothetical protein